MTSCFWGMSKNVVSWDGIYSCEGAVKIVETTIKNLEYCINLVDRAAAGLERIDANFERSFAVGKMPSNSMACCREISFERKSPLIWQTSLLSYVMKLPQPPQCSAPTPWSVSSHQHWGNTLHQQKDTEISDDS